MSKCFKFAPKEHTDLLHLPNLDIYCHLSEMIIHFLRLLCYFNVFCEPNCLSSALYVFYAWTTFWFRDGMDKKLSVKKGKIALKTLPRCSCIQFRKITLGQIRVGQFNNGERLKLWQSRIWTCWCDNRELAGVETFHPQPSPQAINLSGLSWRSKHIEIAE